MLGSARALVVDDDFAEAAGMMRALSKAGIGAVYLNGDVSEFPSDPLSGVRLAALDIFLTAGVGEGQAVAQVASLLDATLSDDNGPYVAVAWTKNRNLVAKLRRKLARLPIGKRPHKVLSIDKVAIKDIESGEFNLDRVLSRVRGALRSAPSLVVVNDWERSVHDAATQTTRSLLPGNEDPWAEGAARILARLLREGVPSVALDVAKKDSAALRRGLFNVLQGIHLDYVEQGLAGSVASASSYLSLAERGDGSIGVEHAAGLNSSLILGPVNTGIWPGHLYNLADIEPWTERTVEQINADLIEDLYRRPVQGPVEKDARFMKRVSDYEAAVPSFRSVGIEVSPSCDHFQGKIKSSRLVLGLLVPYQDGRLVMKLDANMEGRSAKSLGPLLIDGDLCQLVLSSRFVLGCDPRKIESLAPLARVRDLPTHDIQAWVTTQGGRLGMIEVRA